MASRYYYPAATVAAVLAVAGVAAGSPNSTPARGRAATAETTPLDKIYLPVPSFETAMDGSFSTGAAFADLDNDGKPDLILSNGNDMAPQPLMVFYNRCTATNLTCYNLYPDWYSQDFDYHGNLALGDLDHDGFIDLVVSVPFDKQRRTEGGGAKIYRNRGGRLEGTASQSLGANYGAYDVALADVNGDGFLDVVLPGFRLVSPPRTSHGPEDATSQGQPEPVHVFLNQGGTIHNTSDWQSSNRTIGFSVLAADLDQDGWMDLAMAGVNTFVYRGGPPTGSQVALNPTPVWTSALASSQAMFVDAGRIGDGAELTLAVSRGCFPGVRKCVSEFALYRPSQDTKPVWTSTPVTLASMLLLADLNGDGLLDLVGGQWGDEVVGGPLWFFQGRAGGYSTKPDFVTTGPSGFAVAEALTVADTRDCAVGPREYVTRPPRVGAVLTLPDRRPSAIVSVDVAGRRLGAREWTSAVGESWVALAHPWNAGDELRVAYRASPVQDIAEATWNPQRGSLLYNSFLPAGRCGGSTVTRSRSTPIHH